MSTEPHGASGRDIATAAGGADFTVNAAGHSLALERATVVAEHLAAHFAAAG